jgi:hypothetical protein
MIKDLSSAALAIVGGAFTLAIISVLVSRNAQTPAVIQSTGSAIGNIIGQAVSPVTGSGGSVSSGGGAIGTLQNISSGLSSFGNMADSFGSWLNI